MDNTEKRATQYEEKQNKNNTIVMHVFSTC